MAAQVGAKYRTTSLGERLKLAADSVGGLDALASKTGIKRRTLYDYAADQTEPKVSVLVSVAEETASSLEWLATGRGGEVSAVDRNMPSGLVSLPRFDVRASAGAGALVASEDISEHFAVPREWLHRNLPSWSPLSSIVGFLEGSGDSMEPTIRDGDMVGIVQGVSWTVVERGGIFVLTLDYERLLLKRLHVMTNGDLSIISDNKAYPEETIPLEDIQHRVIVHGYVFFSGGRPRSVAK